MTKLGWLRQTYFICLALAMIIVIHSIQIWIWAVALVRLKALASYSDALYFSIVTFTTVGYGDLTIDPEFRIFGAMAAVTGVLAFGISTAMLVNLLSKVFPNVLR
ncbi:MAG: potassium channel family protein [Pseudomonadota bacterium]